MKKNRRRARRALPFALAVAAAAVMVAAAATLRAPRAEAHKFHSSLAEVNHNAEAGTLEVTLRTFPDDLEAALRRRGTPATSRGAKDWQKEFEGRVAAYVGETFQLRTEAGELIKISWVGMDAGVDSVWLYYEARLPAGGHGGVRLRNQFLFDLYDDQINLVNLKAGGKRVALRFERGKADFQTVILK